MTTSTIELLFPIPILRSTIARNFTKDELNFITESETKTYRNKGNTTSDDNYILEQPIFKNLKEICLDKVNEYVQTVYKPKNNISPYITQSWINWTKPGEYHHEHSHPNSILSGVLYINANEHEDKIKFFKSNYQQFKIETNNFDIYNSDSWWFSVKTGDIILFPSSLVHNVETVTSEDTRISLAFNVFLKGVLGDNKELTELKLGI